ncbi:MAG: hypothetical protein Q4B82_06690 [Alysiella sp.]|uniref:hypothetical protein n=1 Tax=Alysiella sp. TaxID=1872483 RepID=UPI0026DB30DD|nr:hypothetical protein [Alysiella sp.]MDO4434250.1 hypothetical protein [Alysiella sp.]
MSIWKRPEELIMAILGVFWVVLTYFLAAYAVQGSVKYVFLITGLTALWTLLAFFVWQRNRWLDFYPVLMGLLVVCWWSWLDWLAVPQSVITQDEVDMATLHTPWYVTLTFKIIIASLPIVALYILKWRKQRERRMNGQI